MAVEKEHKQRNIKSWTRPFARQTISPKNLDTQKKRYQRDAYFPSLLKKDPESVIRPIENV
jgi:hypothetical protein